MEKTATKLLELGADPNVINLDGECAISFSINYQKDDMYFRLLESGAKIDPNNNFLHLSAVNDHEKITQDLIDRGCDIDKVVNGDTPLLAAVKKDVRNAHNLLQYNPNVDLLDSNGKNAIMYAIEKGDNKLALELIRRSKDVYVGDVKTKNWKVLEKLILLGAKSVDTTINEETLLMRATKNGDEKMVDLLLEMGANVSLSKNGFNAISYSLACGYKDIFNKLIARV